MPVSIIDWIWVLALWIFLGIVAYAVLPGRDRSAVDLMSDIVGEMGQAWANGWAPPAANFSAAVPKAMMWHEALFHGIGSFGRGGIDELTKGAENPAQRVFGSFLYLGLLVLFLIADAALAYNIMGSLLEKTGAPMRLSPAIPAWLAGLLADVGFSRVVAFFVIATTLGVIRLDLSEVTHLGVWPRGQFRRVLTTLTLFLIVSVFTLLVFWALGLFATLNAAAIPPEAQSSLYSLSNVAAVAIVGPSFLTALMLWNGVFGIYLVILLVPSAIAILLIIPLIVSLFVWKIVTLPLKILVDVFGKISGPESPEGSN